MTRPPVSFEPLVGARREPVSRWAVAGVVVLAVLAALTVVAGSGAWLSVQAAHRQVDPASRPVCAVVGS